MKILSLLMIVLLSCNAWSYDHRVIEMNPPKVKPLLKKQQPRMTDIRIYKVKGYIGESDTGFLKVKNIKALKPDEQKKVNKLIDEENADRAKIYKEIVLYNKLTKEQEAMLIKNYFEVYKGTDPKGAFYYTNKQWMMIY